MHSALLCHLEFTLHSSRSELSTQNKHDSQIRSTNTIHKYDPQTRSINTIHKHNLQKKLENKYFNYNTVCSFNPCSSALILSHLLLIFILLLLPHFRLSLQLITTRNIQWLVIHTAFKSSISNSISVSVSIPTLL